MLQLLKSYTLHVHGHYGSGLFLCSAQFSENYQESDRQEHSLVESRSFSSFIAELSNARFSQIVAFSGHDDSLDYRGATAICNHSRIASPSAVDTCDRLPQHDRYTSCKHTGIVNGALHPRFSVQRHRRRLVRSDVQRCESIRVS